jgi:hypothetical protein
MLVGIRVLVVRVMVAVLLVGGGSVLAAPKERAVRVQRVLAALRGKGIKLDVEEKLVNEALTWVEADYQDAPYPLTINVVSRKSPHPSRIIYLLTSSSLNFKGSFFTPVEEGLATFLANNGYLVVGVTPREDNVPLDADHQVMADWGMQQHRDDIRMIVEKIQGAVDLPYDMLGHSLGAICALDYAATFSDAAFGTVMALDAPSFDPVAQPEMLAAADLALDAYATLLEGGIYSETSATAFKELLILSGIAPDADSGQSRAAMGLPGNFTVNGLLHFAMIFTPYLDGIISELSGLPQEWPMVAGHTAGHYEWGIDPLDDVFEMEHADLDRLRQMALATGSGISPMPLLRDYTAAIADRDEYRIDWSGIDERLIWINGEGGMGTQAHGAELVRAAGNTNVTVSVIPGYGHIDVLFSRTAQEDVWPLLLD